MGDEPSLRPGVTLEVLDDESVLFDDGEVHRLDATGTAVVTAFQQGRTTDEIADELARRYGADPAVVGSDVTRLVEALAQAGLLDAGGAHRPPVPSPDRASSTGTAALAAAGHLGSPPPPRFTSEVFCALGWRFSIHSTDEQLGTYLAELFAPFVTQEGGGPPGSPVHRYTVVELGDSPRWETWVDGERHLRTDKLWLVLAWVLWHVNQQVVLTTGTHLLLHAAAASLDERAVVISGPMNAGKSTLVAALVLGGWRYLTDEAVAMNLETGLIDPYPRPMTIERGSQALLPGLRPPPSWRARFRRRQWHVDLSARSGSLAAGPARLSVVLAPTVTPGQRSRLEPIGRAEGLVHLCENGWNLRGLGSGAFSLLADAVRSADCYRIHVGDLDEAQDLARHALQRRAAADALPRTLRDAT